MVEPFGLDISNFQRNPVLVWAHDYHSPFAVIGRAVEMEVTGNDFRIRPEWREPVNDTDPMHIIRSLIDGGLVKALSIGFRPIEWNENPQGGLTFTRAEILEVSAVPIPANQSALRLAIKSLQGYDAEAIAERVVELLKEREPAQADNDTAEHEATEEEAQAAPEVGEEPTVDARDEEADADDELLSAIEDYLATVTVALGGRDE